MATTLLPHHSVIVHDHLNTAIPGATRRSIVGVEWTRIGKPCDLHIAALKIGRVQQKVSDGRGTSGGQIPIGFKSLAKGNGHIICMSLNHHATGVLSEASLNTPVA